MNKIALSAIVLLSSLFTFSSAHAKGGKIHNAWFVPPNEIAMEIETPYYCNDPVVSLEAKYSGRASFGPHHYEVNVEPTNLVHCEGVEKMIAIVKVPLNHSSPHGIKFNLHGDERSLAELFINIREPIWLWE